MADKKISQLTALAAANLAPSTDVLAIVDTSATETKKIVAQDLINGVLNVASAVGIGTASPAYKLDVNGNAQVGNATAATNRFLYINGVANKAGAVAFQESGVSRWLIGNGAASENGNFEIYDATNGNNFILTRTGNLGIGVTPVDANNACLQLKSGITFPATQSASGNSNTLDDYEEGTWTPTAVCTGQTITYTSRTGTYTKIGNTVRAQCIMIINTVSGAATGNTSISGLPFNNGDATYSGQGMIGYNDGFVNAIYGTWVDSIGNALFRSGTRGSGNDAGGFAAGGYIYIEWVYVV